MTSSIKKDLLVDSISSALATVPILLWLISIEEQSVILDNMATFNSTVTTVLGLLFTVLAIIYTFESQFEENQAIKKLKTANKYKNITQIFYYSVGSIGIVWIYTFSLSIFEPQKYTGDIMLNIFSYIGIISFILVILRLWRCFSIFVLLNTAIKSYEE